MNRKDFIKICGLACCGGVAVTALLQSCSATHDVIVTTSKEKVLSIKKTEFENPGPDSPRSYREDGMVKKPYVLVKTPELNFPIFICALPGDLYSAVLLECTHNGCELQPRGEYLVCPCHGSEFSKQGVVQNPPAENNLKTFKTTSDNENIYVHL